MAIITISRGSYSKGKEVAEKVASHLGYKCISREVLLDASEHFNIPEMKLVRAIHDAPSILDRFSRTRQAFFAYIRYALAQHVKEDNLVYHGLAGHLLLKGIPNVLKVRVIADLADRIRAEMKRERISEEAARSLLLKDDEERRKWTQSLYGVDPQDSSLYDLVVHVHKLTVDDAVEIISDTAQRTPFKTTKQVRQKMEDYGLACQLKAGLADSFDNVGVKSEYGSILVYAKGNDHYVQRVRKRATEVTGRMSGVNELEVHAVRKLPLDVV
ncbi:MAG: cytidylate kinase-like family protein [Deltaproteobacteria bacterium]|nr:cytidylate kinase-like family protein [Deltaproteobacteria bacterium]